MRTTRQKRSDRVNSDEETVINADSDLNSSVSLYSQLGLGAPVQAHVLLGVSDDEPGVGEEIADVEHGKPEWG